MLLTVGWLEMSWATRRVGEYRPLIGPAPAKMVAPDAGLFVFHASETTYLVPAVIGKTVCTNAALGEKVPAYPPDSFQPATTPFIRIAMSWLYPALAVHRSALALISAVESTGGTMISWSDRLSMSRHDMPSLFFSEYWLVLAVSYSAPYVNRLGGPLSVAQDGRVRVTSTVPGWPGGVTAVIWLGETTVKLTAAVWPNMTAVAPVKPRPEIVTAVPPAGTPLFGLIPATAGVPRLLSPATCQGVL